MEKNIKEIMRIAKEIVDKNIYVKLKKIKDKKELEQVLKYSIISSLEQKNHEILLELKKLEENGKDVFFAKNKAILIASKIKHFAVEFNKDEFYKLSKLLNDIKEELKNV